MLTKKLTKCWRPHYLKPAMVRNSAAYQYSHWCDLEPWDRRPAHCRSNDELHLRNHIYPHLAAQFCWLRICDLRIEGASLQGATVLRPIPVLWPRTDVQQQSQFCEFKSRWKIVLILTFCVFGGGWPRVGLFASAPDPDRPPSFIWGSMGYVDGFWRENKNDQLANFG